MTLQVNVHPRVIHSGSLLKYKSWLNWAEKNFVLTQEALCYTPSASSRDGVLHLPKITLEGGSGSCSFNVLQGDSSSKIYLKAKSAQEKEQWMRAIQHQIDCILYAGTLKKWTNVIQGWKSRYFILYKDRICYYVDEATIDKRRGTINFPDKRVTVILSSTKNGFELKGSTPWYLKASTNEERLVWREKLEDAVALPTSSSTPDAACAMSTEGKQVISSGNIPASSSTPSAPPSPPSITSSSVTGEDSDEETNYRRDLDCTVCMDLLQEPTSLVCGHSYCRDCLADLWASQPARFLCPTCRQEITNVPAKNIALQSLISNLIQTQIVPREASENREAFENRFSRSATAVTQTTASGSSIRLELRTDMEYEFIKRGMCLIFLLWLGSKFVSFFLPDRLIDFEVEEANATVNGPIATQLESRNYVVFLMTSVVVCPRLLLLYTVLLQYHQVFLPTLHIISDMFSQVSGVGLQARVLVWGCAAPQAWLIPMLLHVKWYLPALVCCVLVLVELAEISSILTTVLPLTSTSVTRIRDGLKLAAKRSLISLLLARTISYLPWGWLPDFIYYSVLLFIAAELGLKFMKRVRAVRARFIDLVR